MNRSLRRCCVAWAWGATALTSIPAAEAPVDIGFGGGEIVEVVEGWPFLTRGACEGLDRDRLRVLENGRAVDLVAVERAERTTNHVLLLDTSASMSHPTLDPSRKRGLQTKAAARAYVEWMHEDAQGTTDDRLMLLTFDDALILRAPPTPVGASEERDRLLRIVDDIEGGEGTALNDAIWSTVSYLKTLPRRSVLIVLSDGEDTSSTRTTMDVLRIAGEASEVTVFTLGIGLAPGPHEEFLRELASASGGRHFAVGDKKPDQLGAALAERFAEIRERLKSEFFVSWTPWSLDGLDDDGAPRPDHVWLDVRIDSTLARCKVEPGSYRPQRFVRTGSERARVDAPREQRPTKLVAADRISVNLVDAIRDGHPLRPKVDHHAARDVELVVPDFDAGEPSLAEVVRSWMLAQELPRPAVDRERYAYPLAREINGTTFLEERFTLARAVYDHFEPYRAWARERIARRTRDEYRQKLRVDESASPARRAELEREIEAVVELELGHPRNEDLALELARWHRDVPARELAIGIERLQAERLLAGVGTALEEARAIQAAWPGLYDWVRPPGRVRVTTPLVLAYDADSEAFGLSRIVLPRETSWPASSVPAQPYALQLVRWMLGFDPFAASAAGAPPRATPLAQALHGLSLASLDYTLEPVVAEGAPLERVRIRLGFTSPAGGAPVKLEVVTDTRFRVPAGWKGEVPFAWTLGHGALEPEALLVRCYAAGIGRDRTVLEKALAERSVPACP